MSHSNFDVDLRNEGSRQHPAADSRPKAHIGLVLSLAILVCLIGGIGLGLLLAKHTRGKTVVEPEATAPVDDADEMVALRLTQLAFDEAFAAVRSGLADGVRVQEMVASASPADENMPLRISSTNPNVRVRVDDDDAEVVGGDVYRVRRSRPVEVEFDPGHPSTFDFEISVTPLMDFELVDPYPESE